MVQPSLISVRQRLSGSAAERLHLERLLGNAPERNPLKGIWNLLKRPELKNIRCHTSQQLVAQLLRVKERLRYQMYTLCQCFAHVGTILLRCLYRDQWMKIHV